MGHMVFSRRKVIGQMAVSAAGFLGLSATNKVFAHGGEPYASRPYINASVTYRIRPSPTQFAVGAVVTITCAARGLSFQKATDIGGKARFNLHNYYGQHRSQPSPTDIWIIRVAFRGKTQQLEYRAHPHFPYINSSFRF